MLIRYENRHYHAQISSSGVGGEMKINTSSSFVKAADTKPLHHGKPAPILDPGDQPQHFDFYDRSLEAYPRKSPIFRYPF